MDRDKKSASRTQDSPQLEQPGVGEIRDMGEDRACIDQVEGAILEREMRLACICGELERRAEVLLAEQDILAHQIDAPDFTILQVVKPPDNPPVRTAEIENAPGRLEGDPEASATRLIVPALALPEAIKPSSEPPYKNHSLGGMGNEDPSPPVVTGRATSSRLIMYVSASGR